MWGILGLFSAAICAPRAVKEVKANIEHNHLKNTDRRTWIASKMMEKSYMEETSRALNRYAPRIRIEREADRIFGSEDSLLEELLKREQEYLNSDSYKFNVKYFGGGK